ncbi:MAG: hypothetical protein ACW98Y_13835 [Candidatus Thorarchaeota archaeon]|jgi:ribosomal protein L37E
MSGKGRKKDRKCPDCGEQTFERGTLIVGLNTGGPLRFEFDSGRKIKVRSSACRSCGFLDFRINTKEWEKKRLNLLLTVVKNIFDEDYRVWASAYEEYPNKSGTISIPLNDLSKKSEISRHRMDTLLRTLVAEKKGKRFFYEVDEWDEDKKKKEYSYTLSVDDKKRTLQIDWKRVAKWTMKGKPETL